MVCSYAGQRQQRAGLAATAFKMVAYWRRRGKGQRVIGLKIFTPQGESRRRGNHGGRIQRLKAHVADQPVGQGIRRR